jgi:hypothetical protein
VPDNGYIPPTNLIEGVNPLENVEFDEEDIVLAIKKLKPNISSGPDGLPPLLFKQLKYVLARPLALLFTQLLSVGHVPSQWKTAIITPVFKKGTTSCVTNYRPISLTCVASKIMERILAKRIMEHLIENDLLSGIQHGFVKRKSTCTNLLESLNDWTLAVQDGNMVTVAYIDFKKAFDSVSHEKLFARLKQYGIKGVLLSWLKQFFTGRSHKTRVDTALSNIAALLSGVIQGSGIGPTAFIIYLDDLAKLLEAHGIKCKIFADDIKVYLSLIKVNCTIVLQTALDLIGSWASEWQLAISIEKCNVLNIGPPAVNVNYQINGYVLPFVTSCRDLGVLVTNDLCPSLHVTEIARKGHQRANMILRCFVTRDTALLVRTFTTYVRPLLEYNSVTWSPYLKRDIEMIEKVQRRFTKRLKGLATLTYDQRLDHLNLPSLELRRLHIDLAWCYNIVFGLVDTPSEEFFSMCKLPMTRGHAYKLYKPGCINSVRKNFFANRIVNVWNSLPMSTEFGSINAFKRSLFGVDLSQFLKQ